MCNNQIPLFYIGKVSIFTLGYSDFEQVKSYSSYLSFDVTDLDGTITKLLSMGAELDGPIKHEIHGKVYVYQKFLIFVDIIFCTHTCTHACVLDYDKCKKW